MLQHTKKYTLPFTVGSQMLQHTKKKKNIVQKYATAIKVRKTVNNNLMIK
jgi:hypothetical protein